MLDNSEWLYETLYTLGRDIKNTADAGETVHKLYIRLRELMSTDVFYAAQYVEDSENPDDTGSLHYCFMYDNGRETDFDMSGADKVIPKDDPVYLCLLEDGVPVVSPVWSSESAAGASVNVNAPGLQMSVCLRSRGKNIGALCVRSNTVNAYQERHVKLFGALSFLVAPVLDCCQTYKRLDDVKKTIVSMANHDILTDIPNRRLLFELLPKTYARALRTNSMVAILFLDLDNFKSINDNYGHQTGDEVLRTFKDRVLGLIRLSDIFARVGGDEFILAMTDLKIKSNAGTLAGKIIREVSKPTLIKGNKVVVNVSIGISVFPGDSTDTDTLIELADKAMYYVKQRSKGSYAFSDVLDAPKA